MKLKLIDKSVIISELEKRIEETKGMQPKFDQFWAGQISAFKGVLKILNTLEVKEVKKIEQNPAWSEEDSFRTETLISVIKSGGSIRPELRNEFVNWLKSLKGRGQPKQEWNEEDINMIDWLIRCCEEEHKELCNDKYGHQDIVSDLKRDCRKKWDWLESLKNRTAPQNRWEPSEAQMDSITCAVRKMKESACYDSELVTLFNDLKKLKED